MKPGYSYSVGDLADILRREVHYVANVLAASRVPVFHMGKEIRLSEYPCFQPPLPSPACLYILTSGDRYESPHPSPETAIVLTDTLPPSLVEQLRGRGEANEDCDEVSIEQDPTELAPPDTTMPGAPEKKVQPSPRGIPKQQVMNLFDGLRFDAAHWSKHLATPRKWLIDCRVVPGNSAISGLWNPVLIAAALKDKGVSIKKLDAVFVGLRDWAEEWGEVSAIFRD